MMMINERIVITVFLSFNHQKRQNTRMDSQLHFRTLYLIYGNDLTPF